MKITKTDEELADLVRSALADDSTADPLSGGCHYVEDEDPLTSVSIDGHFNLVAVARIIRRSLEETP